MNLNSAITVKKDVTFRETFGTVTCLEVVAQHIHEAMNQIPLDSVNGAVTRLLLSDLRDIVEDQDDSPETL